MSEHTKFRIAIIAAGLAIALAYFAGGGRGVGAGARDVVFSPTVNPQVQLAAGAIDVPLGAPVTVSSLGARGSLAIALGRRSAIRDFAAISTALAAVIFAMALRAAGFPIAVAILAMLGLGLGDTFWWRGIGYTADVMFPLLCLLAVWMALRFRRTRRRSLAIAAIVCAALAMFDLVRPMMGRTLDTPNPPGFLSSLAHEFTPLGLFLIAIGGVVLARSRATRLPVAVAAIVLLTWHAWWRSAFDPVHITAVLAGWWAIAAALRWLQSSVSARSQPLLLGVVTLVLMAAPMATRWRVHALGGDTPTDQRVRIANDFPVVNAPENVMVISESRRADAALLLSSRLAGRPIAIVPQSIDEVAAAVTSGRPLIAFSNGAANLERYGFLFEPAPLGNVMAAAIVGHVPCAPLKDDRWTDVSLLLANGSLFVHGAHAPPAGVVIRMAAATPVKVAAVEPPDVRFELGDVSGDTEGVPDLIKLADGVAAAAMSSIRLPATGRSGPVTLWFQSPPAYAVATTEEPIATSLCPGVQRSGVMLAAATAATAAVNMSDNAAFGAGWHPVEADPDLFRWTSAPDSAVRVSLAKPGAVRVTITATPASRPAQQPSIAVTVNSCRLAAQTMHAGQGDYEWLVEDQCWRAGVNQLWIHTNPLISPASLFATHDTRLLGSRIGAIRLAR